jgi:hypothetical protein
MQEDDSYVVKGPQLSETIPNVSAGKLLYDHLLAHCNEDEALVSSVVLCKGTINRKKTTLTPLQELRYSSVNAITKIT